MEFIRPLRGDPFPWYRSHARAALITASGLFVAVTGFHLLVNGTGQAVDILYALPIALLAMSFGLRGGLIGAAIGFTMFAVVEVFHGVGDIDVTGWITRERACSSSASSSATPPIRSKRASGGRSPPTRSVDCWPIGADARPRRSRSVTRSCSTSPSPSG